MDRTTAERRKIYALKILYEANPQDKYFRVYTVRRAMEELLDRTLRDDDVKETLNQLHSRGLVERAPESDVWIYRLTPRGREFWKSHEAALVLISSG